MDHCSRSEQSVRVWFRRVKPPAILRPEIWGRAAIKYMANTMRLGGFITEYEEFAGKLAILTGGMFLAGAMITAADVRPRRETLSASAERKRLQERIAMLNTNRP
jgi:hypothetical protein